MIEKILEKKKKETKLPKTIEKEFNHRSKNLKEALSTSTKNNAIIGEIKYSSPTEGKITDRSLLNLTTEMQEVDAISVLTEKNYFNGSIEYLDKIKNLINVPILRKDFIYNKKQLYQTKKHKADAILLITSILDNKLDEFVKISQNIGLEPLVEIKNQEELKKALKTSAKIIGINNRDLDTLEINLSKTKKLAPRIPKDKIIISESGIRNKKDIKELKSYCNAFLVGTALMKSNNLTKKVEELKCA